MSKLTVSIVIYKKNKRPEDRATVAIRVTYLGKSRYKETDFKCRIMDFDEAKERIGPGYSNHAFANASINKMRAKIELDLFIKREEPGFCIQTIEAYLRPETDGKRRSFTQYVQEHCRQLQLKINVAK